LAPRPGTVPPPMLRWLLALVLLIALVAAVAEWWARPFAADVLAGAVQREFRLSEEPVVEIEGTPFLLEAVRGSVPRINMSAADFAVRGFDIERIDLELAEVGFDPASLLTGNGTALAQHGTGTLVLNSAQVGAAVESLGLPITADLSEGRLQVGLEALPGIAVEGRVRVEDGVLMVGADRLEQLGIGPVRVALPDLPRGVVIRSAEVVDDRLVIQLEVEDLAITY
jgi:hypothetical protein